jgi:hypothetical protein
MERIMYINFGLLKLRFVLVEALLCVEDGSIGLVLEINKFLTIVKQMILCVSYPHP